MATTSLSDRSDVAADGDGIDSVSATLIGAAVVLAVICGWLVFSATSRTDSTAAVGPLEIDQSHFAAETGVWIEHLALLAGGGVIEIRYRIIDGPKSQIVHDLDNPPRLILDDGFELDVPRHEHPHDYENIVASTYNEQVVNLGGMVERGDEVTVVIGTTELPGVTVW